MISIPHFVAESTMPSLAMISKLIQDQHPVVQEEKFLYEQVITFHKSSLSGG